MASRRDNIVPLHRAFRSDNIRSVRPIEPDHLEKIFRLPSARETGEAARVIPASSVTYDPLGDEQPDAIHWPSFFAGIILGLAGGLLAIALPAIVLARILYGVWF